MLTQRPTPVSKCEFNVTSFLTLPQPLHCLICPKDIMVTAWLAEREVDGGGGGCLC